MQILLVQPDPDAASTLAGQLKDQSCLVEVAHSGGDAQRLLNANKYEVLIVSLALPDMTGVDLCRQLRRRGVSTPIIILSAMQGTDPTVRALDAGADDYVEKPVEFEELWARVRAMVRRCRAEEGSVMRYAGIEMDLINRGVTRDDQPLTLTPREFALLEYLMRHRDRVVSRAALGDRVWGIDISENSSNVVDACVSRLRRKLDKDHPVKLLHTVPRVGYLLSARRGLSPQSQEPELAPPQSA